MIIDAFPFFQENDILALRLYELAPVVDRFIIVEAHQTHKGDPKPLYLDWERFAPYHDKMYRITVDLPDGEGLAAIWRREIAQRQNITTALNLLDVPDGTIVLVSDCDEIPRREIVAQLHGLADGVVLTFDQTLHYYDLNTTSTAARWRGTRATTAGVVRALGADGVRYDAGARGGFPQTYLVPNAGWHLSYFGGAAAVRRKADSFLHQELRHLVPEDEPGIAARIAAGHDLYGRAENAFTVGAVDDVPTAVRDDPERWAHLFKAGYAPVGVS